MNELGPKLFGFGLLVIGALAVYGVWNKPDQTRPTSYDKGVYGGAVDQQLDPDAVNALAQRAGRLRNSGR
jgi:hypothetical protein